MELSCITIGVVNEPEAVSRLFFERFTTIPVLYFASETIEHYCVEQCTQKGIHSPYDLVDRVISAHDYEKKWIGWCDQIHTKLQQDQK